MLASHFQKKLSSSRLRLDILLLLHFIAVLMIHGIVFILQISTELVLSMMTVQRSLGHTPLFLRETDDDLATSSSNH